MMLKDEIKEIMSDYGYPIESLADLIKLVDEFVYWKRLDPFAIEILLDD